MNWRRPAAWRYDDFNGGLVQRRHHNDIMHCQQSASARRGGMTASGGNMAREWALLRLQAHDDRAGGRFGRESRWA